MPPRNRGRPPQRLFAPPGEGFWEPIQPGTLPVMPRPYVPMASRQRQGPVFGSQGYLPYQRGPVPGYMSPEASYFAPPAPSYMLPSGAQTPVMGAAQNAVLGMGASMPGTQVFSPFMPAAAGFPEGVSPTAMAAGGAGYPGPRLQPSDAVAWPAQDVYGVGTWPYTAQNPQPATLPTGAGGAPGGPGAGRGSATPPAPANPAPPGINQGWWDAFTREHGGENPQEFYERSGEGLQDALWDRDWSEQFARDTGRPPNDDEWRAHWFMTRTGATQEQRDEWKRAKEIRRALRRYGDREPSEPFQQRPPVYVPPYVIWG